MWETPNVTGKYTIIATFVGTNGYYGSQSQTSIAIVEPSVTPPPSTTTENNADANLMYATISIVVAIIVVGIVLAPLIVRKRP